ncbi:MAG: CsoS2 family carboxysome shell protein [Halochromatium sp.]|uniref:CsoS2 family carboxysome shell protein n=1 Tax=Halochromatium sp. TaxID=2049430 RepID=UPI00397C583B
MASIANLRSSGREAALARRRALSSQGKQGLVQSTRERTRAPRTERAPAPAPERARPEPASASAAPARASNPSPSLGFSTAASPQRHRAIPQNPAQASREFARQRRAKLARDGRRAQRSGDRVRDPRVADRAGSRSASPTRAEQTKGECQCGGKCKQAQARLDTTNLPSLSLSAPAPSRAKNGNGTTANGRNRKPNPTLALKPAGRAVAQARRSALSGRGKGATNVPSSVAGIARQANPKLSGRELAQQVRAQRSSNGGAGERKSPPAGRVRRSRTGAAADQPWKVGVSETVQGQFVTGTRVGRSQKTTGDEPSTCRTITGTEYMGADIFREFCQTEPAPAISKIGVSPTGYGNYVTGNEVGRSPKVTGNEPGTCTNVTGTQYLSPDQYQSYCNTRPAPEPRETGVALTLSGQGLSGTMVGRSGKVTGDELGAHVVPTGTQYTAASEIPTDRSAPPKVGTSATLSGGTVTGTRVGRAARVTGDEPGTCRLVTGDQYADRAQYESFCEIIPQPEAPKVGQSMTNQGHRVSGTQTGRSNKVTGDEPGTCKAVTGTPYAGLEQAADYCASDQQREIKARTPLMAGTPGPSMTGIQPGIGGVMTGAAKGACESLTGTPYVGADQFASVCATDDASKAAEPGQPDFPRPLDLGGDVPAPALSPTSAPAPGSTPAPGQGFSVSSPARAAFEERQRSQVTGTSYESNRHITGPFGMGTGKITGTEQFRFDSRRARPDLLTPEPNPNPNPNPGSAPGSEAPAAGAAAARSRITGEGQSAGKKITGDDWDRGERVTGTEGSSARRRNPTRPGVMSAMPSIETKRNEEVPQPTSRVTGSAGSTDRGALITYSGGARG